MPLVSRTSAFRHATIHADVGLALRSAIEGGGWRPGFRLPAERELGEQYRCARMTVRRALQDLEAEGLIVRRHGSGTFVADLRPISSELTVKDIHQEILGRGHRHQSQLIKRATLAAGRSIAPTMRVARGSQVFMCEVVHLENGTPVQFEQRLINPRVLPDFLSLDLETKTASSHLFERAPLTAAEQVVEAVNANTRLAVHLHVATGAALLRVSRRTESRGVVASLARLYHPGHAYRLIGEFST